MVVRRFVTRGGAAALAASSVALVVGLLATAPAQGAPAAGTVTVTPAPSDDRLLPDLIALPAGQPQVQVRSDGLRLRFTSSLGNVGAGPVEVRPNTNAPCPAGQHNATQIIYRDAGGNAVYNPRRDTAITRHRAGCMLFHPFHHHWHFKASARYTLLDPSQDGRAVVSVRRKVSFCLRDSARVPARYGSFSYGEAYGACGRTTPQGISIGWMDVYQRFLAGQSLRLPKHLKRGLYCLETVVDPLDQLLETDDDNNSSMRALVIRGDRVTPRETQLCRAESRS
jgi:lysyl oxidase